MNVLLGPTTGKVIRSQALYRPGIEDRTHLTCVCLERSFMFLGYSPEKFIINQSYFYESGCNQQLQHTSLKWLKTESQSSNQH